jgi:hypothetical protein
VFVVEGDVTKGPYKVLSISSDCVYKLKLLADNSERSGVAEDSLRETV